MSMAINFIYAFTMMAEGIVQSDFEKLTKSNIGLGLKNISSRMRVVHGSINFEKDISQTYYKITLELPKDDPYES
jgi:signal transduction histidine kinase